MRNYSECSLTHGSDRLAALLGIASAIQRKTGWDFTAGLWLPYFLRDMLWCTLHTSTYSGVGPSWSWISTMEKVFVCSGDHSQLRELAEVFVPEESIVGCVSLTATADKPLTLPIYVTSIALEVDNALGVPGSFKNFIGDGKKVRYDRKERLLAEYFLLMSEGSWHDDYDSLYFLVIASSGVVEGAFERIGYWEQGMEKQGGSRKGSTESEIELYYGPLASRGWLDNILATGERRTFTLV